MRQKNMRPTYVVGIFLVLMFLVAIASAWGLFQSLQ